MKAIKIILLIFLSLIVLLFCLYYTGHDSNDYIYKRAKKEVNDNAEDYSKLYKYLSDATSDKYPTSLITYRNGWGYVNFSLFGIDNKEKSSHKEVPPFIEHLLFDGSAFYNGDNSKAMYVSFPFSNYKLYETRLIYSNNQSSIVNDLILRGYKFYDSTKQSIDYGNCIIWLNKNWLLSFYK